MCLGSGRTLKWKRNHTHKGLGSERKSYRKSGAPTTSTNKWLTRMSFAILQMHLKRRNVSQLKSNPKVKAKPHTRASPTHDFNTRNASYRQTAPETRKYALKKRRVVFIGCYLHLPNVWGASNNIVLTENLFFGGNSSIFLENMAVLENANFEPRAAATHVVHCK